MPTADYECPKCGFKDDLSYTTLPAAVEYPHNTPQSWDRQAPEWCKREKVLMVKGSER